MFTDPSAPKKLKEYRQIFTTASIDFGTYKPAIKMQEDILISGSFKENAAYLLENMDNDDFRMLAAFALRNGYTSNQKLHEQFGNAIPRNAHKLDRNEKWPVPNPVMVREILTYFSTLDPSPTTCSKLPWRHSQYARPEAEPVLPNSPRMAMGHLRR